MSREETFDVVVIGAGAAGMTTAAVAARQGLDVVVLEKTELVGGNTSFSGGMIYMPANDKMPALGMDDSPEDAMTYLDQVVGTEDGREMRLVYASRAADAVRYLEANTAVELKALHFYPDYYPELEGAHVGGRCLEPVPFDAGRLGPWFSSLRPPIAEFTVFGGMMVAREDLPHYRKMWRSPRSFLKIARLLAQYAVQRLRYHRGTRLVQGNALAGQLLKSLLDLGVEIRLNTEPRRVLREEDRVTGVAIGCDGETIVRARRGVVLAAGGFSQSVAKRRKYLPPVVSPHSPYAPGSTGDGLDLGEKAGGSIGDDNSSNAYWTPASIYHRADGKTVVYPHTFADRGKPGSLVVNASGRRFANEAVSYHRFGEALSQAGNQPAWIVADSDFVWKYGLGAILPYTFDLGPYSKAGYVVGAPTLSGLANRMGVDEAEFCRTISRFNSEAARGEDTQFGRGMSIYALYLGDAEVTPNPCLGPVRQAPFYAVQLVLSDLGTVAGLRVDTDCRVLDSDGRPVEGLFAVGNDAQSIMRGGYPGPGTTLGPALTFGYLLGQHLAGLQSMPRQ